MNAFAAFAPDTLPRTAAQLEAPVATIEHPGEILGRKLAETGATIAELSRASGLSSDLIVALLRGKRVVTAEIALALADFFGSSARIWLDRQRAFDAAYAPAYAGRAA
jgi:addiction module HigA family antidote